MPRPALVPRGLFAYDYFVEDLEVLVSTADGDDSGTGTEAILRSLRQE